MLQCSCRRDFTSKSEACNVKHPFSNSNIAPLRQQQQQQKLQQQQQQQQQQQPQQQL
jgi:hypothetical protein